MNSRPLQALAASFILAGCAVPGTPPIGPRVPDHQGALSRPHTSVVGKYIKHIVIVIQENRSFDNIFAGYPGADTATIGRAHDGSAIPLRPIDFAADPEIAYTTPIGIADYDGGKMDGFDLAPSSYGAAAGSSGYAFLRRDLVQPYWAMAQQYVLADHMFPTQWGQSFTAHLDLIAGTTLLSAGLAVAGIPTTSPWGCDSGAGTTTDTWSSSGVYKVNAGPFPCYDGSNSLFGINSMADTLDAANVSWHYYAPPLASGLGWSSFDAIKEVRYGPDWQKVISPQTKFLTDAASSLPSVSWVVPDWADSDHDGSDSNTGPSWVAAVVNAVGRSKFWDSTAIIVLWDDWGGWYDNAPPPQLDFMGLGIRVPCIIISPYAREHYVSHTQYEFGSVLRLVEQAFNVPSLGVSDMRANSLIDGFDFTRPPRRFTPISAPYGAVRFRHERPSLKPPDDM